MVQRLTAPTVRGSFALASALIIHGSWFAGGWGTAADASIFGGVGQLGAGAALRDRDRVRGLT